jgi:hypothetical protein
LGWGFVKTGQTLGHLFLCFFFSFFLCFSDLCRFVNVGGLLNAWSRESRVPIALSWKRTAAFFTCSFCFCLSFFWPSFSSSQCLCMTGGCPVHINPLIELAVPSWV